MFLEVQQLQQQLTMILLIFDGITGVNIAYASGYVITTGLYKNGAAVVSSYTSDNLFFFYSKY
jgi:hypothetical protein